MAIVVFGVRHDGSIAHPRRAVAAATAAMRAPASRRADLPIRRFVLLSGGFTSPPSSLPRTLAGTIEDSLSNDGSLVRMPEFRKILRTQFEKRGNAVGRVMTHHGFERERFA